MTAKSLESLLNPGREDNLGAVVRRARELAGTTDALRSALPEALSGGVSAVNLRESTLVVVCGTSAWASRLRFEEQALLEAAKKLGLGADRLVVRVARGAADQA